MTERPLTADGVAGTGPSGVKGTVRPGGWIRWSFSPAARSGEQPRPDHRSTSSTGIGRSCFGPRPRSSARRGRSPAASPSSCPAIHSTRSAVDGDAGELEAGRLRQAGESAPGRLDDGPAWSPSSPTLCCVDY